MDPADIARLRQLLRQKQYAEVLAQGEALLANAPTQRDAMLFVAVAQRYLGRPAVALATLERLEQAHPRFSRLHEERGRCFVDMKNAAEATRAFERAVALNPSLQGCWRMLEGLYRMTGQGAQAQSASQQLAALQQVPPDVVSAAALFADGELEASEALVRSFLIREGDNVEGMRLLAAIGIERKVYDDA